MSPILEVNGLGKKYRLGSIGTGSLRDELSAIWRRRRGLLKAERGLECAKAVQGEVWALRGVSFNVARGDIVGIIGLNGAGKSTLLKILSRITEPTEGELIIRGRLASLLEVGTGFHPELTGRENVFLNGSILGMRKVEISEKFERIVEFAGVQKFIDTPVKRYSSGMFVRLAFSVAVHLEPEIMIVDEVLSVGDFEFQAKCIQRMRELTRSGKTILLVSHNLYTLQTLCQSGILLADGKLIMQGAIHHVIAEFRKISINPSGTPVSKHIRGDSNVSVESVTLNGHARRLIETSGEMDIKLQCRLYLARPSVLHIGFSVKAAEGVYVCGLSTFLEDRPRLYEAGVHSIGIVVDKVNLSSGSYMLALAIMNENGIATHYSEDRIGELVVMRQFKFDGSVGMTHKWIRE